MPPAGAAWRGCQVPFAWFGVVSRRVLVGVLLVGSGWRDMGEARPINVRF